MSLSVKIRQMKGTPPAEEEPASFPQTELGPHSVPVGGTVGGGVPTDFDSLSEPPPSVVGLIGQALDLEKENRHFLRPSGFGGCPRAQIFGYLQVPPSNLPQPATNLQIILHTGTKLHEMLQAFLANHPGVFWSPEVPIWVPELSIKGSCDGILSLREPDERGRVYRWGVEFKTINSRGFDALKGPKPEHVVQASIYARLSGVYWISIVYFNKDTHGMKEYPVAYNPNTWQKVLDRVAEVKAHVARKSLPIYDSKVCQNSVNLCSYVAYCHGLEGKETPPWWNGSK